MKKRTWLLMLEGMLFAFAGVGMYLCGWFFLQRVTSTDMHLLETLPYMLSLLFPTYGLFVLHLVLWPHSPKRRKRTFLVNGLVFVGLGLFLVLYDLALLGSGIFPSLVWGLIHPLYPLDTFLSGVLFAGIGVLVFLYGLKKADSNADQVPYFPAKTKRSKGILHSILFPIYVVLVLFFTGDLLYFFHTLDYEMQNVGIMIPIYLLMLSLPLGLGLYEYYLRPKKQEKVYLGLMLRGVPCYLLVSVILSLWAYFGLLKNPLAFSESFVAIFPLDGEASVAVGPLLLYALNLLAPLIYLLSFIFTKTHEATPCQEVSEKRD